MGLAVWAHDIGTSLTPDKLADMWEQENGQMMTNLARRLDPPRIRRTGTGLKGHSMIFREYRGQINSIPTRTYMGCTTRGSRAYVVLGVFREGDTATEQLIRQSVLGFRLTRPSQGQLNHTAGVREIR